MAWAKYWTNYRIQMDFFWQLEIIPLSLTFVTYWIWWDFSLNFITHLDKGRSKWHYLGIIDLFGILSPAGFSSPLNRIEIVSWIQIKFEFGHKAKLTLDTKEIWIWTQINLNLDTNQFEFGHKSIWIWAQITFEVGYKSIWIWTQIKFEFGHKSIWIWTPIKFEFGHKINLNLDTK